MYVTFCDVCHEVDKEHEREERVDLLGASLWTTRGFTSPAS